MEIKNQKESGLVLEQMAVEFEKKLKTVKTDAAPQFGWYPYGTLSNFYHLKTIFNKYPLENLIGPTYRTLDIGAADGDLAFFMETLGYRADIIDYPPGFPGGEGGQCPVSDQCGGSVASFLTP